MFMSFGRKFWAGRKLVDFGRVADTDRKQEIRPEDGERSSQDCFFYKNELKGVKARQAMAAIWFHCVLVLELKLSHATLRTVNYTNFGAIL